MEWIFLGVLSWNLVTFVLMYIDKRRSKHGKWRIPEATLLLYGLMLGAPGLWFGMKYFRHKTKHSKFVYGIPVLGMVNGCCLIAAYYLYLRS